MSAARNSYEFIPPGRPAPNFRLTAVKTNQPIGPKECAGRPLGLVFHNQHTVQAVVDVNTAVRPLYPHPSQVTLASVVDLSAVPRMLHRMVQPFLERAYDEAASHIPAGYQPAEYVFLLPDWDGKASKAFGVTHADKTAAIVVIDGAGNVVGSYQGPEPGPATLRLVQQAMGVAPG